MKVPEWLPGYGDFSYRNKKCPKENSEQISFFDALQKMFPEYHTIALHPKNEGKRTYGQAHYDKKSGLNKGASDVVIPAAPQPLVLELKRRDHTICRWEDGQLPYLENAQRLGAYSCVALGWEAAIEAVAVWHTARMAGKRL